MYRKNILILVIISGLLILTGCAKKDYNQFKVQFNKTYLEIAESVDITDTLKTLKDIQSEENKNKIIELKILLESTQNKVPKDKKDEYERYKEWYKGLIILRDTPYSEWDKLLFEQKSNVWIEISLIDIRRE